MWNVRTKSNKKLFLAIIEFDALAAAVVKIKITFFCCNLYLLEIIIHVRVIYSGFMN